MVRAPTFYLHPRKNPRIIERKITVALLLVVASLFLLLHLDSHTLYTWDEATNALQVLEMEENGNYLRRHFLGRPDTWETKPPLLTWLQVGFTKLLGAGELAIRLPSALAALLTVLGIWWFLTRYFRLPLAGLLAGLATVGASGYATTHVARSGDHDALLIFWLLGGALAFYRYLTHLDRGKGAARWLLLFGICFTAGIYTKSIAGLFFAPGILLGTLVLGKILVPLRDWRFYAIALGSVGLVALYYVLNERATPGYWQLVWENELFPRFNNTATTYNYNELPHRGHYLELLFTKDWLWFSWLLPVALIVLFWQAERATQRFAGYLLVIAATFLLVISNGTYNSWYHAPVLRLLSIPFGIGLALLLERGFRLADPERNGLVRGASWAAVVLIFGASLYRTFDQNVYFAALPGDHNPHGEYLRHLAATQAERTRLFAYYPSLNRPWMFYEKMYQRRGYQIRSCGPGAGIDSCRPTERPDAGEAVIICDERFRREFTERYEGVETVDVRPPCSLHTFRGLRE